MVTDRSSYREDRGVEVNGALIRSAVMPTGGFLDVTVSPMGYEAGSETLDGPFLWRIEAEGRDGYHQALTVHRVKVETRTTQRSEWYPDKLLGKTVEFFPLKGEAGEAYAQYQIPGKLEVFPSEDGAITIIVDLTVRSIEKSVREMVTFRMAPERTRDVEMFLQPGTTTTGDHQDGPKAWRRKW